MEGCPFKDFECYDFDSFNIETRDRLKEIQCLIGLIKEDYEGDLRLYPALRGIETLIESLCFFLDNQEEEQGGFERQYNEKRALADACRLAKARDTDRDSTRS